MQDLTDKERRARRRAAMGDAPCCMTTAKGEPCAVRAFDGLPCCWDHVSKWATESFDNLRRFLAPRALRVVRVDRWHVDLGGWAVVVHVCKLRGELVDLRKVRGRVPGATGLHMGRETAQVAADLLASLGNDAAAEAILQTCA